MWRFRSKSNMGNPEEFCTSCRSFRTDDSSFLAILTKPEISLPELEAGITVLENDQADMANRFAHFTGELGTVAGEAVASAREVVADCQMLAADLRDATDFTPAAQAAAKQEIIAAMARTDSLLEKFETLLGRQAAA